MLTFLYYLLFIGINLVAKKHVVKLKYYMLSSTTNAGFVFNDMPLHDE